MGNAKKTAKRLVGRYTGPGKDYFTPEQRAKVDEVLAGLRTQVGETINREAPGIKEMAPEGLPYVAQGMLEELIEELNELV